MYSDDVLMTDSGTEFRGSMERLNDLFAVQRDMVPDQAKWRLGHAERRGAILKIMMMKTTAAVRIDSLEEMQHALTAALVAKNRLTNTAGVSPLQAVTGRNSPLPGSLLAQISSGKVRYVTNEALDKDESLRRAERIRAAAIESCHWLDAHEGLRRALASRSRPPHLELLREGTVVYVYDPPAHRKSLARRLQDNASWSGPAVVVCVERQEAIPKKVWVRLRNKVKAYPLEKIRLATADEMVSAEFITNELQDVQAELDGGTLRVAQDPILKVDDKKEEAEMPETEQAPVRAIDPKPQPRRRLPPTPPRGAVSSEDSEKTRALERKREFLHDLPEALDRKKLRPGAAVEERDPSKMQFEEKRQMFERLAEDLRPPTNMQEAALRSHLEGAYEALKKVRKTLKKEKKEELRAYAGRSSAAASKPSERQVFVAMAQNTAQLSTAEAWDTAEYHAKLWEDDEEGEGAITQQVIEMSEKASEAEMHAVLEANREGQGEGGVSMVGPFTALEGCLQGAVGQGRGRLLPARCDSRSGPRCDGGPEEDPIVAFRADEQGQGELGGGRAEGTMDHRRPSGPRPGEVPHVGTNVKFAGTQFVELPGSAVSVGGALRGRQCGFPTGETSTSWTRSLREAAVGLSTARK